MVIKNPQYKIVSDLTPSGITKSASLANANIGARKVNNKLRNKCFFIFIDIVFDS